MVRDPLPQEDAPGTGSPGDRENLYLAAFFLTSILAALAFAVAVTWGARGAIYWTIGEVWLALSLAEASMVAVLVRRNL